MVKQQKSVRFNFFLNASRVVFGILIGFFTMPYVNRTIGVDGLGKVEYVNSIITYFILFSGLGIPMYGIRETANKRNNVEARSKLVIELLSILTVTTIVSYLIMFFVVLKIPSLESLKNLIVLTSSMIFLTNLGVEWFYQGIEDQLYITARYFFVRILALILLFVFVTSKDDYLYYSVIMVLSSVGGNLFNLINLKKYISFKDITFESLDFKQHLKPIFTIFIASISISIYVQLDNLMLGALNGSKSVGYYAMANKLIRFVIVPITTLGTVLLPRLSFLVKNDKQQYFIYIKKVLNYFLILSFPFVVLFLMLAKDFTLVIGGQEFLPSVLTMQILSPIIIIVSFAYFLGYLVLYPQGKEYIYTTAVILSASLSIIFNFYLIPKFGYNGAAVVAVLSELVGVIVMVFLYYKELSYLKLLNKSLVYFIASSVIMGAVIFVISFFNFISILNLIVSSVIGGFSFFLSLYFFKEITILGIVDEMKSKLRIFR
ncbi:membrane protein involved in the export of O-antigen and teichoic acid [Flavobacterium sp. CF136]|nr:membrane protein involved in the export of O-antigen and teichoic acid [Flavobacterium sp. CF136]